MATNIEQLRDELYDLLERVERLFHLASELAGGAERVAEEAPAVEPEPDVSFASFASWLRERLLEDFPLSEHPNDELVKAIWEVAQGDQELVDAALTLALHADRTRQPVSKVGGFVLAILKRQAPSSLKAEAERKRRQMQPSTLVEQVVEQAKSQAASVSPGANGASERLAKLSSLMAARRARAS